MKKKGHKRTPKDPYADLNDEMDRYDVSGSDEDSDSGQMMVSAGRRVRPIRENDDASEDSDEDEEEVLKTYESEDAGSDGDDNGELGSEYDSDIEDGNKGVEGDDDDLPDSKAWGTKRQTYYNTDYVDKDYLGFDDEEAALMEEQEASEIQKRLMRHMDETDFSLGLMDAVEEQKQEFAKSVLEGPDELKKEKIPKDLSKLTQNELLDILKRDSPGFLNLIEISRKHLLTLKQEIEPILGSVKGNSVNFSKGLKFLKTYKTLICYFTMNAVFFTYLKSKRVRTDNHPIVKRLEEIEKLLRLMNSVCRANLKQQMDRILDMKKAGRDVEFLEYGCLTIEEPITGKNSKERRLKKLQILKKKEKEKKEIQKRKKLLISLDQDVPMMEDAVDDRNPPEEMSADETDIEEGGEGEGSKRPITFEMMKNKGLTVKRKKEMRNPRVRNKNKYRKALKRRKGQVRNVVKEVSRYGGEATGINKYVSKSVKIK